MNTFAELDAALISDLSISANSSLFPTATRKLALNRAYIKIAGLFRWPSLEDAKTTSTAINQAYYDAPSTWQPDSIWRLEINGEVWGEVPDGSPMAYPDFLLWKENNPNSTEKKWAVQWMRYFVTPTPTTVITQGISIWGLKNITTLVNDSDTTIFSYNKPEVNLAIIHEAVAILKQKGDALNAGQMFSDKATQLTLLSYTKVKQEQIKYEKTEPMLYVPDFFGAQSTRQQVTGNFQ